MLSILVSIYVAAKINYVQSCCFGITAFEFNSSNQLFFIIILFLIFVFTKYAWTLARVAYSEGSLAWRNCRSASGDPGEITKSHWEISQDSEIPIYQGQEPASSLNVPYFKSKWGSDTKLNSMSIVKTVRGILDPNHLMSR